MDETLDFMVYCIESYKNAENLRGREAVELFNKYHVFDYIKASHGTQDMACREYIIEDLNMYIDARRQVDTRRNL
ncbi:hypothetical protein Amet_0447 [Alkaliphilus metalliredigens QYMF]|uniref:DUF3791 domain-containing protein n=1 Tax=Alkaliphilus metalliredigens (strain QYMF) TaxID=293826 RepID=A6TKF7_ALKMQ|nr:DUF3791 domain-containing protein [Alkaliphilus metalliredigens]ABR46675.1 hypothetical protein Amet_0447 [Alkaliphilus metalliredigens QYMF]